MVEPNTKQIGLISLTPWVDATASEEADSTTPLRPHEWETHIRCNSTGPKTYHYHICTVCGAEGVRRKVSNRKAIISQIHPSCQPFSPSVILGP